MERLRQRIRKRNRVPKGNLRLRVNAFFLAIFSRIKTLESKVFLIKLIRLAQKLLHFPCQVVQNVSYFCQFFKHYC